ncbi:MAG: hypothetical protein R3F43_18850 [bacterium]
MIWKMSSFFQRLRVHEGLVAGLAQLDADGVGTDFLNRITHFPNATLGDVGGADEVEATSVAFQEGDVGAEIHGRAPYTCDGAASMEKGRISAG